MYFEPVEKREEPADHCILAEMVDERDGNKAGELGVTVACRRLGATLRVSTAAE